MERLIALLCGVAVCAAVSGEVSAALVANEPYDYPPASDLSNTGGGSGWTTNWASNLGATAFDSTGDTAGTGSMSYVDSLGNSLITSGNRGLYQGTLNTTGANGVTSNAFRRLPAIRGQEGVADNTTTWVSFVGQRLGQKSGDPPTYQRGTNVSLYNSTLAASQEQLAIGEGTGRTEETWTLIPNGDGAQTVGSSTPFDQLSLVVVRIDHKPGNDDAYLFMNPTLGVEPAIASASASSIGTFDYSFDTVRPFAGGSQNTGAIAPGEIQVDEIRVGDTYADVTPFVPEPTAIGVAGVALMTVTGRTFGRKRAR
jgi:hypothetical protein